MIACIVGALFVLAGVVVAAIAAFRFKKRLDRLKANVATIVDAERINRAQGNVARLQYALSQAAPLAERAKAAIDTMNQAFTDLKLPQAVSAMRAAAIATRLIFKN